MILSSVGVSQGGLLAAESVACSLELEDCGLRHEDQTPTSRHILLVAMYGNVTVQFHLSKITEHYG